MSIHSVYRNMLRRCYNSTDAHFHLYGGRGIRVCDEWLNDRQLFFTWVQSAGYAAGLTLDRRNNDGNYTPDNCRFVSMKEQQRNKRTNLVIVFGGISKIATDWALDQGLERSTVAKRLRRGMSLERAVSPLRLNQKPWEHGTRSGYDWHRCRCDACRAFNTQRARDYHLQHAII
jgi:hypothetical protein